ncbi:MAG: SRPBCC family protein [Candidatus Eisenbacteria bacterium]
MDNVGADCGVHGTFVVGVPAKLAWEVLTDYDGLSRFVTSMHSSRLEEGDSGRRFVRQEAVAKVFFVRRRMRVLLEIQEDPLHRVGFRDVLGKDFRSYIGEWKLSDAPGGTRVEYQLVALPRAAAARVLCRGLLVGTAHDLLVQVRAEMLKRAAKAR